MKRFPYLLSIVLALASIASLLAVPAAASGSVGTGGKTAEEVKTVPKVGAGGEAAAKAAAANASLLSGHPIDALASYTQLLESPQFARVGSPELWCNRGLAEEKTGDPAAASLSFRRALLLDPGFVPAQQQLAVVLTALGLPTPSARMSRLFTILSPEEMILGGAVLGWIGLFLLVILLVRGPRRRGYIVSALLALILGHGASLLGSLIDPRRGAEHKAVVTAKKGPALRSTPADSATVIGNLAPGAVITILSQNGAWWYVSSGRGKAAQQGWILSEVATPLLPPSCALPSRG